MLVPRTAAPSHTSVAQGLLLRYDEAKANIDRDFKLPPSHIWQCTLSLQGCVGSCVRHYWQNGGTSLNLLLFCRHGPRMKESGFMILTCFFLSSAELNEENIKVLIVFERSMRRHKAFCSCAQRIIHKVNHWHLFKDFYKIVFQGEHTGHSLRPWEGLLSEAHLWEKCLWQKSLLNLGLRNN